MQHSINLNPNQKEKILFCLDTSKSIGLTFIIPFLNPIMWTNTDC